MTKSVDTLIRKMLVSMRDTGKTLLAVFRRSSTSPLTRAF